MKIRNTVHRVRVESEEEKKMSMQESARKKDVDKKERTLAKPNALVSEDENGALV